MVSHDSIIFHSFPLSLNPNDSFSFLMKGMVLLLDIDIAEGFGVLYYSLYESQNIYYYLLLLLLFSFLI